MIYELLCDGLVDMTRRKKKQRVIYSLRWICYNLAQFIYPFVCTQISRWKRNTHFLWASVFKWKTFIRSPQPLIWTNTKYEKKSKLLQHINRYTFIACESHDMMIRLAATLDEQWTAIVQKLFIIFLLHLHTQWNTHTHTQDRIKDNEVLPIVGVIRAFTSSSIIRDRIPWII